MVDQFDTVTEATAMWPGQGKGKAEGSDIGGVSSVVSERRVYTIPRVRSSRDIALNNFDETRLILMRFRSQSQGLNRGLTGCLKIPQM